MQTTYFTADLHLGHQGIIDHCYRPFTSVEEMDNTIIDNINHVVKPKDALWVLGDFSLRSFSHVQAYRDRIKCSTVHLVRGNHDGLTVTQYKTLFTSVSELKEIKVEQQRITLCHYAMRRWNKSHLGSWHLYGHSHGCLNGNGTLSFDVGVDARCYSPLSFEEVAHLMRNMEIMGAKAEENHPTC